MTKHRKMVRSLSVSFLFLFWLWPLPTTAAQESPKILEWGEHANLNCRKSVDPDSKVTYQLELEDVILNGRSILVGERFVGDVRDLVFVVKNDADRPLEFIQITLVLMDVKRPIQVPFVRPIETRDQVRPGEQTELHVPAGKVYDWVNDAVASQGMTLSTIKRAAIDAVTIGSIGQGISGCIRARDPRNQLPPK